MRYGTNENRRFVVFEVLFDPKRQQKRIAACSRLQYARSKMDNNPEFQQRYIADIVRGVIVEKNWTADLILAKAS